MSTTTPYANLDLSPLPGKQSGQTLPRLVGLMQRLLAPGGCPWDREQTLRSLLPYVVEETYEVVDAVTADNLPDHREELGDLLLQVIFQAELRSNEGAFGIDDVIAGIVEKLVRRHPHVFGDAVADTSGEVLSNWARIKAEEKAQRGKKGALEGVPRSAPALVRASRTGEKAAAVGFDFPDARSAREKLDEELAEFDAACGQGDQRAMADELGDVLFAVVNLARRLDLDPENALRAATDRFANRFAYIEESLEKQGRKVGDAPLDEQNRLWDEAKRTGR